MLPPDADADADAGRHEKSFAACPCDVLSRPSMARIRKPRLANVRYTALRPWLAGS